MASCTRGAREITVDWVSLVNFAFIQDLLNEAMNSTGQKIMGCKCILASMTFFAFIETAVSRNNWLRSGPS